MTDVPSDGSDDGSPDEVPGEVPGGPAAENHQETGLDLARSVARSVAGTRRRSKGAARGRRPKVDPQASGAHPDERDPQTLDTTIGRLISDHGWDREVRVHGVFSRWDALVGREVAQHCTPVSYARDDDQARLVVQTDSTAWATQMRLLAPTVVRRLNQELGEATVTLIDVRGPAAPSWVRGRRSVRDGRGPRDTYG